MNAEIIAIGDEITSGQLLDTNTQWLSLRLEELGVRVLYHSTVGDELEPGADVFRRAIDRADVIVATGGLGPTADDLTRDALAMATGCPLQRNDKVLEHIRNLFARRKWPMPPQNELQALFPAGSRVIENPHGTAPGIDMDVPREGRSPCRVFVLPGVPAEMFKMWHDSVSPAVRVMPGRGRVIRRRNVHCFGAGEGKVESMLPDLIRRGRHPTVGITASQSTITLRIAAEGDSEAECDTAIEPVVATIRQCLGTLAYGEGDDTLQEVVVRRLQERRQTLATVEWGTSGLLADWLGHVANSSATYLGGLVVANDAVCRTMLDLPADASAAANDAERWVMTMATGVRQRFGADYGLAIGPCPKIERSSTSSQVVETKDSTSAMTASTSAAESPPQVSVALATADGVQRLRVTVGLTPALVHIYCVKQAMNLLRLAMP